jgi:tripeptidyl-peptidase-1
MQIKSAFVAAAILAFCDALATPLSARSPYVVKETHYVPKEWQKQDRAHGGKTISLQIGLKQGRFEELDRHLHEGKNTIRKREHQTAANYEQSLTLIMLATVSI